MKKANETIVLLGKRRNLYICDSSGSKQASPALLQVRIVIGHHPLTGRPIQKIYKGHTASEIHAQVEQDFSDGIISLSGHNLGSRVTIGELVDRYMAECSADLRENTLRNYSRLARLIKEHLGDRPALLLTSTQVSSFLLEVKAASATGRSSDGICAVNDCLFFFRRVMNYGIECGAVRVNPCLYVSKLRKVREEHLLIDPEKIADYLRVLEDDLYYGDVLAVIALSGIRIGEGIGMQADAFDRDKMKLKIKSHISYTKHDGTYQNVLYQGRKCGDIYSIDLFPPHASLHRSCA